ncbi:uncharacterized protein LOC115341647 [Aquila chrysaetos chrysaetos]|uniref:uncharacterized protein LOC115341647 n=1 Tax=Aquila chrysaetos chrysaetos TaxID=223781 RepID=UPI001177160D|nr:uncharacterized protein LOC115341647 [Aquila chrysaetos chrysaetos]
MLPACRASQEIAVQLRWSRDALALFLPSTSAGWVQPAAPPVARGVSVPCPAAPAQSGRAEVRAVEIISWPQEIPVKHIPGVRHPRAAKGLAGRRECECARQQRCLQPCLRCQASSSAPGQGLQAASGGRLAWSSLLWLVCTPRLAITGLHAPVCSLDRTLQFAPSGLHAPACALGFASSSLLSLVCTLQFALQGLHTPVLHWFAHHLPPQQPSFGPQSGPVWLRALPVLPSCSPVQAGSRQGARDAEDGTLLPSSLAGPLHWAELGADLGAVEQSWLPMEQSCVPRRQIWVPWSRAGCQGG